VTIVGPSPLDQDRTCVAGQLCVLDGLYGQHLLSSDSYFILDTCGLDTVVARLPQEGLFDVATNSNGSRIGWGVGSSLLRLTAAGGEYRLCWCAGTYSCTLTEDLRVDMGRITIMGPAPLYHARTCVGGQTCHVCWTA
jgi:hypothetical protein